jgi:hypothetical protein
MPSVVTNCGSAASFLAEPGQFVDAWLSRRLLPCLEARASASLPADVPGSFSQPRWTAAAKRLEALARDAAD